MKPTFFTTTLITLTTLIAQSSQKCISQPIHSEKPRIHRGFFSDKITYPINYYEIICNRVTLASNTCELDKIGDNIKAGSHETHFIVSDSNITTLFEGVLQQMPNTVVVSMNHNSIGYIETDAFDSLYKLRVIDLSFNNLTGIQDQVFTNNYQLETINLSRNNIVFIGDVFPIFAKLTTLLLQHNKLHNVNFTMPRSLTHLDLSFNEIETIDKNSFYGSSSLNHLFLNNNRLTTMTLGCFRLLNNLIELNLSNNKIIKITYGTFTNLNHLKILNLKNNSIETLSEDTLNDLDELADLNLENNLISTLDGDAIAKHLKTLKTIGLDRNRLVCHHLAELVATLKIHGIAVHRGNEFFTNNVKGIACVDVEIERLNMHQESEEGSKKTVIAADDELKKILTEIAKKTHEDFMDLKQTFEKQMLRRHVHKRRFIIQ